MSISEGVVQQIKDTINIVDLIEEYLPIKKVGKNYRTNCPFHQDDTPSFYVSPELNIFHCFGCGKSGDIFTFIMEYDKTSFSEALRILANKAGIEIGGFEHKNKILYLIHDFACEFYHKNLLKSPKVLEYLKKRGNTEDTIGKFKLGFAPSGSELLKEAKKEFKIDDLINSGLVKKTESGLKDRFFLRLMFPLFSISGQVIGFGGRRLSKGGAKYLNSPDTPIHKKGKNLYSLWHTKEEIRKNESAILVEGYFDFLSLYQEGVKNTAACLGTSLTNEQAELLSRYADEVIIFFDKDAAGRAATLRSLGMLLNLGVTVKIGNTGSRKDPDEIILKGGVEEFKNFLSNASDFIIYTLDRIKEDYDLSSPIGLSKGIERVSIVLSQIRDPLKKELYKEIVSRKLMIREDLLNIEKSTKTSVIANKTIDISDREKIELGLFYAITQKVEEREVVFSIISDEDISNPYLKKAFRLLKKGEEIEIDDIIQSLSKNQIDYLLRESQQPEISALSSALRLKNYLLDNLIDRKRRELQKVEENGGDESMLLKEIKSLIEERVRVSKEVIGEI